MVLGTIEILALIIAVVAAIKILVILVKPKAWMEVVKAVYKSPRITMIISTILAAVVLYYLNNSGISIIQIFAVMLFLALLMAVSVSAYAKDMIALGRKMLKDRKILKKAWLSIVIWALLIIWVLYSLFA